MPLIQTFGAASARGFGAFASLGSLYWIGTLGAAGTSELGYSVAVDSLGDVYLAGKSAGLGISKYSSTGIIQWQRKLGSGSGIAYGIAVDSSNNVYIIGTDFISSTDIVIAKYNSSGVIQWQRSLSSGSVDLGHSIAVDTSGNVYICGASSVAGSSDIQIAKYNSSGAIQWQRRLDSPSVGSDTGYSVAVDSSGNVYVCGHAADGSSTQDIAVAKYNTLSGTIQWQRTLDIASQNLYAYGIAVDSSNNPYITGSSRNVGVQSICIIKYDTSGTLQWQRLLENSGGNASNTTGYGIAIDSSNNVYINGVCNAAGTIDFQIAKYNSSGTIQWQRRLGSSSSDYGQAIAISGSNMYLLGNTDVSGNNNMLFSKVPNDGSKTGTYAVGGYSFTYASTSLTDAAGTLASSSSSLTDAASTLTSAASSLTDAATTLTSSVTAIP